MGAAYFYHLTRRGQGDTLRMLLGKALEQKWRVEVRGTDAAAMEALDRALWITPEDSFLPHGLAGGPMDADQPVLLTCATEAAAQTQCLMTLDSAPVTAAEVDRLDRVCVLFDGNDDAALNHARNLWKVLKEAGSAAQYWSEESGRWEKKAET